MSSEVTPLDILSEDLLTLQQAAKEIPRAPGQSAVHYSTVFRWMNRGLRGHKLMTVRVGQQCFTSKQRLHAFLAATNGSDQ